LTIKWQEELSVDGGPIDQDHHTLIAIINSFEDVRPGEDTIARLTEVLAKLEQYGSVHFEREEQLQRTVSFPYAESHDRQHRILLDSLARARTALAAVTSDEDLATFRSHMCGFLHDWLLDHIIQNDLLMKPFVRAMAPHAALIANLHAAVRAMAG